MLFSSPAFFAFFAIYFTLHFIVPRQWRLFLIIVGSTIFYAWWRTSYVWVPFLLVAIAYTGSLAIVRTQEHTHRRLICIASIASLFLPLVFFKYTDFVYADFLGPMFGWTGKLVDMPLPLGVSFVTFTLTAYVVDIYRGAFDARHRLSTVLAYVLFFPHLIAGPILRPVDLIPQLEHPRPALIRRAALPVAIFTVGLVKKLVFADQIGAMVDAVYAMHAAPTTLEALLAIYGFSVQIYCDFSGYTDMAIGLALLLGIRLPNNFLQPYAAASLIDFWRRWHITLSFWLRDYLYFSLGGNRAGKLRQTVNILITMVLGGLWHGANWTFVLWGLLHGSAIAVLHRLKNERRTPRWLATLFTFHFVTFAWILFRAPNLSKAGEVLGALLNGGWIGSGDFLSRNVFTIGLIAVFLTGHRFDDHRRIRVATRRVRAEIFWPTLALLWILAITLSQGSSAKFIYFDF